MRRRLDAPVAPLGSFARSLLERLERELTGEALSPAEMDERSGEMPPMREAMSVIPTDPIKSVDLLGEAGTGTRPDPSA